jgi:drug/metabolite transporter (DMT)-like permease
MLAIALALGASVVWGVGDFLGGLKSRGLHVLTVLVVSQLAGLAAVAAWVAVDGGSSPGGAPLALAAAAGLAGAVGLASLYRGMAIGAMGIVAPISAVAAAVPFSVGVVSGERPGAVQLAGVVVALAGVGLASRQPVQLGGGRAAGVGLALLAAAGFGLYFVLYDNAADASVPWAVVTARATSSAVAVAVAVAGGIALRAARSHLPALVAIGVCDVGANVLFGLATTRGYLSVVSVLSALYPIVTMGLAAVLLHERIAASQRVGVGGALAGAALISLG